MDRPISIDLPHQLGAAEARRRIQSGIGRLKDHIPGGAAEVASSWSGDRMNLKVVALAQEVSAQIDVQERLVRLEVLLPPALAFFGRQIEGVLRRQGAAMLEDKSKKKS
jgi:hypothetical protein